MVPPRPGITNALGCLVADLRHDYTNTINRPLDLIDMDEVHALFSRHIAEGEALLAREHIEFKGIRHLYSVDMQFAGQSHLIRVPIDTAKPDRDLLRRQFEEAYFRRFRVELDQIRANLVNVNTSVIGVRPEIDLSGLIDPAGRKATLAEAATGRRPVYFEGGFRDTPVYWRDHLPEGFAFDGPAIVQQMDTTVLIEPGDRAEDDGHGNIIITVGPAS
jgi:N-methylhydantoinase A